MSEKLELITPGKVLYEEFMEPLGLTQNKLSVALAVSPNRINQIINNRREITADTALRLARFFGNSAQFWLNMQTRYNLRLAEREYGEQIVAEVRKQEAA